MSDTQPDQSQGGWLFRDEEQPKKPIPRRPRRPFTLRPFRVRSVYFWMNVAFVVVLLGLLLGESSQLWFVILGVAWVTVGVVVVTRSRRNQPRPPSLFDEDRG